jgi:CRP/FNR family cyclic AMP-dependent transcriptional regulator
MSTDRAPHVQHHGIQPFDPITFLTTSSPGKRRIQVKPKGIFYSQGGVADAVFYLQSGRAKLTVVSDKGKEATVTLLSPGDFVGEEAVAGTGRFRMATASAITTCILMKISSEKMLEVLHDEQPFSEFFLKFMLERGIRIQADLIDQLFNSSEKRLARILLLMAHYGTPGEPETLIPPVTQETLAEMIGTTRSRVSFFMNRFRRMGYIEYKGRIRVHRSLLNVVLHENISKENSTRPALEGDLPSETNTPSRIKTIKARK